MRRRRRGKWRIHNHLSDREFVPVENKSYEEIA